METNKVLAALLERPEVSAKDLATLAKVKPNTVTTVIQRYRNTLSQRRAVSDGKRGQPELLYSVKAEWIAVLRQRIAVEAVEVEDQITALEQAIASLEAASFASVDPVIEATERTRMKASARLRSKSARALLEEESNNSTRVEALERIDIAERRYNAQLADAGDDPEGVDDAALYMLKRWNERAVTLCKGYGAEILDGNVRRDNVALILDLVQKDVHQRQTALMDTLLREQAKAAMIVPLMGMSVRKRGSFLKDFEALAFDPTACLVKFVVMVDSDQQASRAMWKDIDALCHTERADRAMKVGLSAIAEAANLSEISTYEYRPLMQFMTDCVQRVLGFVESKSKNFWGAYGEPNVVDVSADAKFRTRARKSDWTYNRATPSALPKVISAHSEAQEARY